jgi:hypothetical protein
LSPSQEEGAKKSGGILRIRRLRESGRMSFSESEELLILFLALFIVVIVVYCPFQ